MQETAIFGFTPWLGPSTIRSDASRSAARTAVALFEAFHSITLSLEITGAELPADLEVRL
jgi:hypothetical protein